MKKAIFFVLFGIVFLTYALEAGERRWESSAAIGANLSRGNSDSIFTTASFDAVRQRAEDILRNNIQASYGKKNDETVAKEISLASQYNRTISERTFWSLSGSFEHNEISDIDYRYTIAPAYGYYFIKEATRMLEVSAGLAYVGQKFDDGETDNYISTQIFERFEMKMDNSRIWNTFLYLPDISDFGLYIIRAEVGFDAGLSERTGLRLLLRNVYDSSPPGDRVKNDFMMMSMLTFKL